jgi:hypothetical protein
MPPNPPTTRSACPTPPALEPSRTSSPHDAAVRVLSTAIRTRLTDEARHLADQASDHTVAPRQHVTSIADLITALRTEHHRWHAVPSHYRTPDVSAPEIATPSPEIAIE